MKTTRLLVVVALAACGGSSPGPAGPSTWSAPSIAAHVPADTPYVLGSFEPVGEKLRRRMLAGVEQQLEQVIERTRELAHEDRSHLEPWLRAGLAVLDKIRDRPVDEWAEALGFARDPRWVVYGLGIWPVARIDVADAQKLHGVIEQAIKFAGADVQEQTSGGHKYWRMPLGSVELVAAVLDHELVAALLPARGLDVGLANVLGTAPPAQSLATARTVPEMLARYKFVKPLFGYVDTRQLVQIFTRTPTELDAVVRDVTGPVSPACKADLERLSGNLPRVVFGYRQLDEHAFDGALIAETSAGRGLASARDAVPGVSVRFDHQPLFAFGVAARSDALLAWLGDIGRSIAARPFTCEYLTWIDEAGVELTKLSGALPAPLRGIQGFSVVVDDASVNPPRGAGDLLVVGEHAYDLLAMIDRIVPVFGGKPPPPDGKPVEISLAMLGIGWLDSVHIAAKPDRVAISIGKNSDRRVVDRLATTAPSQSPFVVFAMDTPRFEKLMKALGAPTSRSTRELGSAVMHLEADDDTIRLVVSGQWAR